MTNGQNNKKATMISDLQCNENKFILILNNTILFFNLGQVQKSIFGKLTLISNHSFHESWDASLHCKILFSWYHNFFSFVKWT